MPITHNAAQKIGQAEEAASALLGQEIAIHNLRVPGIAPLIQECTIDTRGKLAIAISKVDFYPAQSPQWQERIDRGAAGRGGRHSGQIYADFSNGHPLVSVVLPREPGARTDPLAVIKRVLVASGDAKPKEYSWDGLLTGHIGMPSQQLLTAMDALNFSLTRGRSPVHIRPLVHADVVLERPMPKAGAHKDFQAAFALTKESRQSVIDALTEKLNRDAQERTQVPLSASPVTTPSSPSGAMNAN